MPIIVDSNYGLSDAVVTPKNPISIKDIILELAKCDDINIYPLSISNLARIESPFAQGVLWGLFQSSIPNISYSPVMSFVNGEIISNKFFVFEVTNLAFQFFCFSITERSAIQIVGDESCLGTFENLVNLIKALEN